MQPRKEKDDALLADAFAALDAYEKTTGKVVVVHIDTSSSAGNCRPGVLEWRQKWCGGREIVPAREILTIAAECRDRVPAAILGVMRAIKQGTVA